MHAQDHGSLIRLDPIAKASSVQKTHTPTLAHLGLEAVLGFELRKEGFGIERFSQDLHLTLHGCKVTQAQLVELRQPFAPGAREGLGAVHPTAFT